MTEYIIKKLPVTTKRATVKLRSNHVQQCYVCCWYVFVST